MRTLFLFLMFLFFLPVTGKSAPYEYQLDPDHSYVGFKVKHIGYAYTVGRFNTVSGEFIFNEETRELKSLKAEITGDSVDTAHKKRDNHIRNSDFLDVKKHPLITFSMTDNQQINEKKGTIIGNLTLLGITKSVTLDVIWHKSGPYPFGGGVFSGPPYVLGASARTTIKRSDFGMTYGVDSGLVGDDVDIIIEIEAIRGDKALP